MPTIKQLRAHLSSARDIACMLWWSGWATWATVRAAWRMCGALHDAERISGIEAQAEVLDNMAESMGVSRRPGENDGELRARVRREVMRVDERTWERYDDAD